MDLTHYQNEVLYARSDWIQAWIDASAGASRGILKEKPVFHLSSAVSPEEIEAWLLQKKWPPNQEGWKLLRVAVHERKTGCVDDVTLITENEDGDPCFSEELLQWAFLSEIEASWRENFAKWRSAYKFRKIPTPLNSNKTRC